VLGRSWQGKAFNRKGRKEVPRRTHRKNPHHRGHRERGENRVVARLDHLVSKEAFGFLATAPGWMEMPLGVSGAAKPDKRSFDSFGWRLTSLKMTRLAVSAMRGDRSRAE
jgi:hypothetical protein